jgi:uncharacterized protein YecE (DUF72 family)
MLRRWAHWITEWRAGGQPRDATRVIEAAPHVQPRDVYCYFDNTDKLHAPPNARRLMALVNGGAVALDRAA